MRIRHVCVALALAAMLLRAVMPAGWMPNPDGAASSPFTICTMYGPLGPGPLNHDPSDDSHHQPCPFAAAPHFAAPLALAVLQLPSAAAAATHPSAHFAAIENARRREPQSPRAPPSLA